MHDKCINWTLTQNKTRRFCSQNSFSTLLKVIFIEKFGSKLMFSLSLLCSLLVLFLAKPIAADLGEPGPLKVGDEYETNISPQADSSILPDIKENGRSATYQLRHTGASYMAVLFEDFNLKEGCTMTVSGEPVTDLFGVGNGKQEYEME